MKLPTNLNRKTIVKSALNYAIYIMLLFFCLILSFTTDAFLTFNNIVNVFLQTSIIGILAIGVSFVLITGNNDISMGAVMAVSSAAGVGLIKLHGWPWWAGMIVIILVAVAFGLLNGTIIAYVKVPAFLATLSTQYIARGLSLVLSGGSSWFDLPKPFTFLASAKVASIPLIIIIMFTFYLIFHIRLRKTIFGRRIYAVGSSKDAARVSGINVNKTILFAYVQCGLLVGCATILQTSRMNSFWASMGTGLEFQAIAASIIGGVSMSGGVGRLTGTLAGVLLIGIINNALNLYGVDANWQEAVRGFVILMAVLLDAVRSRYNAAK